MQINRATGRTDESEQQAEEIIGNPTNTNLKHIRFHDIQHFPASIMVNHGIPLMKASYILGQSQP
jgi:hypothetical protein